MNEKYKASCTLVARVVAGCLQSLRPASGKNVGTGGRARKPGRNPVPTIPLGTISRYERAIFGLQINGIVARERLAGGGE